MIQDNYAANYYLQLPKPRTLYYKKSLLYNGAKLWNSIPKKIRRNAQFFLICSIFAKMHIGGFIEAITVSCLVRIYYEVLITLLHHASRHIFMFL